LSRMPGCPLYDLRMRREPDIPPRLRMANDFLDDPYPRPVADDVRMQRKLKHAAFLVSRVEFAAEYVEHVLRRGVGSQGLEAMHHEIDGVVTYPFDRKLCHAGRLTVEQQLVTVLVGHKRGVVEQPHLPRDAKRVLAEVP